MVGDCPPRGFGLETVFMRKRIARFLALGIVTVAALVLAIAVTAGGLGRKQEESKAVEAASPPSPVSVEEVQLDSIEITDTYVGMIRPLERFMLGFEVAGRVIELGVNEAGNPLVFREAHGCAII